MTKKIYLIIFLIAFYLFITQFQNIARLVYPFHYRDIINEETRKYGIEPYLVVGVIRVESGFRENAESNKGARGLMQVMPQTGIWVAEQIGLEDYSEEKLFDPHVNISIGTWYLVDLLRQFNGNVYAALAAYNGGRGHVSRWLEEGIWDGSRDNIGSIPFPETRAFVLKVERAYNLYRLIYEEQ